MQDDRPAGTPSGYICPSCGGALWQRTDGDGSQEYQCRIGHAFTPEQLWINHCAARNRAVAAAARAVAENTALARALAEQARMLGKDALAARLEEEARSEERHVGQLLAMLEDLADDAPSPQPDR